MSLLWWDCQMEDALSVVLVFSVFCSISQARRNTISLFSRHFSLMTPSAYRIFKRPNSPTEALIRA